MEDFLFVLKVAVFCATVLLFVRERVLRERATAQAVMRSRLLDAARDVARETLAEEQKAHRETRKTLLAVAGRMALLKAREGLVDQPGDIVPPPLAREPAGAARAFIDKIPYPASRDAHEQLALRLLANGATDDDVVAVFRGTRPASDFVRNEEE